MAGVEFDQDIHIAVGPEVVANHGAEKRQSSDAVLAAKLPDGLLGNWNFGSIHIIIPGRPPERCLWTTPGNCTMTLGTIARLWVTPA